MCRRCITRQIETALPAYSHHTLMTSFACTAIKGINYFLPQKQPNTGIHFQVRRNCKRRFTQWSTKASNTRQVCRNNRASLRHERWETITSLWHKKIYSFIMSIIINDIKHCAIITFRGFAQAAISAVSEVILTHIH